MTMFVIQSAILFLIAYILGCIVGKLLHRFFSVETQENADLEIDKEQKNSKPLPPVNAEKSVEVSHVKNEPESEKNPKAKVSQPPLKQEKPAQTLGTPKPAPELTSPALPDVGMMAKDDLKQIRGIGPKIELSLNRMGITSFPQIAAWTDIQQSEIGNRLSFSGRIEREEWVEQAKILASGGKTEFADRVDQGEVPSSSGSVPSEKIGVRPSSEAQPVSGGDDLTLIDGIGSALEKKLNAIGVYTFAQISQWNKDHQIWIGNEIGFSGRPERENWVMDAKALLKNEQPKESPKPERGAIIAKRKS